MKRLSTYVLKQQETFSSGCAKEKTTQDTCALTFDVCFMYIFYYQSMQELHDPECICIQLLYFIQKPFVVDFRKPVENNCFRFLQFSYAAKYELPEKPRNTVGGCRPAIESKNMVFPPTKTCFLAITWGWNASTDATSIPGPRQEQLR